MSAKRTQARRRQPKNECWRFAFGIAALFALIAGPSRLEAADAAAAATTDSVSLEARRALFAYDARADLAIEEERSETQGHSTLRPISFVAIPGKESRTRALLVLPSKLPPRAAILWVHWLGPPAETSPKEFLEEATALAESGVASLLVETMWTKSAEVRWTRPRSLRNFFP